MTQLESAKNNIITPQMRFIADNESIDAAILCHNIAKGLAVIFGNNIRKTKKICAVGYGLRTKVNANLGMSPDKEDLKTEIKKLRVALKCRADTIMDLSVGNDIAHARKTLIANCPVPFGTVPVYEAASRAKAKYGTFLKMTSSDILAVIKEQAQDGVDFFTIHSGITLSTLKTLKNNPRLLGIVSRGGAILAQWAKFNKKENPFYAAFDEIIDIAKTYDIVLSLGDGMRPGSIIDASDKTQLAELKTLGKLAKRAQDRGVSVIIEGPGHIPINEIEKNVYWEKKFCHGAPFYILGPLVTDIAAGYDHITAAIGGAIAASAGADFLCYVTPAEHLRHPSIDDVKEGVIAARIAAHAADIVKIKDAANKDRLMSLARKKRHWNKQISLAIDPEKAKTYRLQSKPHISDTCTMCGEYCSMKLMEKCRKK